MKINSMKNSLKLARYRGHRLIFHKPFKLIYIFNTKALIFKFELNKNDSVKKKSVLFYPAIFPHNPVTLASIGDTVEAHQCMLIINCIITKHSTGSPLNQHGTSTVSSTFHVDFFLHTIIFIIYDFFFFFKPPIS